MQSQEGSAEAGTLYWIDSQYYIKRNIYFAFKLRILLFSENLCLQVYKRIFLHAHNCDFFLINYIILWV